MTSCGVAPYVDHTYIPVLAVFLALAVAAVFLRFFNKFKTTRKYGWDDWFLLLALAGCVAYSAIAFEETNHGLGTDVWAVEPDDITYLFTGFYISMLMYAASRLFIRHSIILFYLRIFTIGNPRPIVIGTMVVNTALSVGVVLSVAFQCQPVSLFWTRWDLQHEGHCLPSMPVFWSGAIATMVMDVWVILLPLPYVARLQLSLKKRLGVSFMLAIGVSVVAFSILKFLAVNNIDKASNPTVSFARVGIWSALEIDLGVLCTCLPSMRLLIGSYLTKWGWVGEEDSVREAPRISFRNNHSSSRTRATPGSTFQGSRDSQSRIRITTTIQQNASPSESETYLPLHSIELGTHQQGVVKVQAWS
ncbi:21ddf509-0fbb-4637-ba98-7ed8b8a61aa5 [Thermothielavioides terrestris]|uniref:21ddf509-0fbb-4637-ba98-7ed8b8a61aa5 n=1 Tax=Thermothielavioides terrestris TaxID=2587410 RepID=A0A3S4EX64_9PEZI|nr:21ddf509-0fbb-4637-ba98-7ed8b8a61aa5 [Thermothielavioides terrestris]